MLNCVFRKLSLWHCRCDSPAALSCCLQCEERVLQHSAWLSFNFAVGELLCGSKFQELSTLSNTTKFSAFVHLDLFISLILLFSVIFNVMPGTPSDTREHLVTTCLSRNKNKQTTVTVITLLFRSFSKCKYHHVLCPSLCFCVNVCLCVSLCLLVCVCVFEDKKKKKVVSQKSKNKTMEAKAFKQSGQLNIHLSESWDNKYPLVMHAAHWLWGWWRCDTKVLLWHCWDEQPILKKIITWFWYLCIFS